MERKTCEDCGRLARHPARLMGVDVCHRCSPLRSLGSSLEIKLAERTREAALAEENFEGARDANPHEFSLLQDLNLILGDKKRKQEEAEADMHRWRESLISTVRGEKGTTEEYNRAWESPEGGPEVRGEGIDIEDDLPF